MTEKIIKCDMCGSSISNGKCSCGRWYDKVEDTDDASQKMKKALESFHEEKRFTITGDMPHLGCACVYFRGDYNDCKKVEKFIYQMKGRPYYED